MYFQFWPFRGYHAKFRVASTCIAKFFSSFQLCYRESQWYYAVVRSTTLSLSIIQEYICWRIHSIWSLVSNLMLRTEVLFLRWSPVGEAHGHNSGGGGTKVTFGPVSYLGISLNSLLVAIILHWLPMVLVICKAEVDRGVDTSLSLHPQSSLNAV